MADSLILMVMALVVFGPRRLPQIGRQIGKLMYEFRKASNDFKFQMEEELRNAEEADRRKKEEARLAALALSAPPDEPKKEPDVVPQVLDTGDNAPSYYEAAAREHTYPYEGDFPAKTDPGIGGWRDRAGHETRSGEAGAARPRAGRLGATGRQAMGPRAFSRRRPERRCRTARAGRRARRPRRPARKPAGRLPRARLVQARPRPAAKRPWRRRRQRKRTDTVTEQAAQHG